MTAAQAAPPPPSPPTPGAAANEPALDAEQLLEAALIHGCKLSPEALEAIAEAQQVFGLNFAAAALRLGYVTEQDIDAALGGSPSTALVPKKQGKPGQQLVLAHDPFNPRSEKVRALRTELLLRHDGSGRANIVVLLSACSGEGRSLLAAELAISFSQLGQPTLLVDADLRRPRQHLLFGTDNAHGLSQAIAMGSAPYVRPVENLPMLSLMTAGPVPPNPVELLSDGRFAALVETWRRRYAHVVIDTAPVNAYSDALAVATLVGRSLVLSRAQHTPYKATREMLRRLSATQSQIVGAVISHF
jgi:protein-tyrosine kinase